MKQYFYLFTLLLLTIICILEIAIIGFFNLKIVSKTTIQQVQKSSRGLSRLYGYHEYLISEYFIMSSTCATRVVLARHSSLTEKAEKAENREGCLKKKKKIGSILKSSHHTPFYFQANIFYSPRIYDDLVSFQLSQRSEWSFKSFLNVKDVKVLSNKQVLV